MRTGFCCARKHLRAVRRQPAELAITFDAAYRPWRVKVSEAS